MRGHVHGPQAFLLIAVHILSNRIARLLARFDKRAVQRVAHGSGADLEWAAVAAVGITADRARFGLFEVGQAMRIRPVLHAVLQSPTLVIQGMAAHIDHAINGRGATQGFAARTVDAPLVHKWLGLGLVLPAIARIGHGVGERRGHMDKDAVVIATSLDQKHAHLSVLAQAVGKHATGRTGAHDDVIKFRQGHVFCSLGRQARTAFGPRWAHTSAHALILCAHHGGCGHFAPSPPLSARAA